MTRRKQSFSAVDREGTIIYHGLQETKVHVRVPGINAEGEEVMLETFTTITAISIALAFGLRRKKV